MYCGLCKMKVKDWKIHTEGALHRKNLKIAADDEFGLVMGSVAKKQLLAEAKDKLDEAFNKMKKGMSGEETEKISRGKEDIVMKKK